MISISTILIVLLILMLLGALPTWGHSRNWGHARSGGLGLVVVHSDHPAAHGPHMTAPLFKAAMKVMPEF